MQAANRSQVKQILPDGEMTTVPLTRCSQFLVHTADTDYATRTGWTKMADGIFDLAERRLAWLDQRQTVLAQNVANADTPGFRAKDVAPFADQISLAQAAAQPVRTDPMHLPGTVGAGAATVTDAGGISPSGNSVQLDGELVKVADTDANQEMVGDLYKKYLSLYRAALGR